MEKFLNKAERKFGKYAINNLTFYIIVVYIIGYIVKLSSSIFLGIIDADIFSLLYFDVYKIAHGQVWRLISWIIIPPPSNNPIWFAIALFCFYSFGKSIEMYWGAFKFNFFILTGLILTVVGVALSSAFVSLIYPFPFEFVSGLFGAATSTYYISMSVFIMLSLLNPEARVLLFFIIPLKSKYVAIFFIAYDAYEIIYTALKYASLIGFPPLMMILVLGIAFIMSLVNVLIYFLGARNRIHLTRAEKIRMAEFRRAVNSANSSSGNRQASYSGKFSRTGNTGGGASANGANGMSKHKCAICGRTELDDPDLEFRFCSKCNGNYEYCNEHLFTHTHK